MYCGVNKNINTAGSHFDHVKLREYSLTRTPDKPTIRGTGSVGEIGTLRNRPCRSGVLPRLLPCAVGLVAPARLASITLINRLHGRSRLAFNRILKNSVKIRLPLRLPRTPLPDAKISVRY